MNKRTVGTANEKKAVLFLQNQGYDILETNYRCRLGEIDIIAREGRYLVFVEVKYRKDICCGLPEEAVDGRKQRKLAGAAGYYLWQKKLSGDVPCRFDVVGICGRHIRLLRDAFQMDS